MEKIPANRSKKKYGKNKSNVFYKKYTWTIDTLVLNVYGLKNSKGQS